MSVDARRAAVERGARAERLVADLLIADGWQVRDRNWHGGGAELDLVVERAGVVRFVEVKARAEEDPTGVDAVGLDKRRRLSRAAEAWLSEAELVPVEVAFLVALVEWGEDGARVEWIDDAFDGV